jgi:hypothetical protein
MEKFKLASWLLGLTALAASPGAAALVNVSDPDLTGTGVGAVLTIVTAQENGGGDGFESGCVSWNGSADALTCTSGFEGSGGDEGTGASQTLTRELSEITDLSTIAETALIVNINEPGNDGNVDLRDLYFAIYGADGAEIFSAFLGPETINLMNGSGSGTGQSGFLFVLDSAQQAAAQAAETAAGGFNDNWRVGGGFLAENFAGGPETVFVVRWPIEDGGGGGGDIPEVPEPASSLLMGGGLLAIASLRRLLTKS